MATETESRTWTDQLTDGLQAPVATVAGLAFAAMGIVGFLQPGELLFGVFGVNALHNAVHLTSGLLGVAAGLARGGRYADLFNKGFSLAYAGVLIAGIAAPGAMETLLNANTADRFLHLGIVAVLGGVGFMADDRPRR